jgi:hypothetical protein
MRKALLLSIIPAAIAASAGCATAPKDELSPEAAAELAKFERTGEMQSCVSIANLNQIKPLSDKLFLVRVGVNDYYLNEVSGRCSGASSSFSHLQYTTSLTQLCRNEIIHVVDTSTGMHLGACGLGSFEKLKQKPPEPTMEGEGQTPEQ